MASAERFTLAQIKAANKRAGKFFFSPGAVSFFASSTLPTVYHGKENGRVAFVTSEVPPHGPKAYTARAFSPDTAAVDTIGPHCELTLEQAQTLAVLYCAGSVPGRDEGEGLSEYEARLRALVV